MKNVIIASRRADGIPGSTLRVMTAAHRTTDGEIMIGLDDGPDGLREESLPADTQARLDADTREMARRTVAALHAELAAETAAKAPVIAESRGPAVTVDHSEIPTPDLEMALRSAALSPDGEVYPWRDLYPLAGQTVYAAGQFWTVARKETGPGADSPIAIVQLVGCGHDGSLTAARYELRPASWTQHDEDWCGRE